MIKVPAQALMNPSRLPAETRKDVIMSVYAMYAFSASSADTPYLRHLQLSKGHEFREVNKESDKGGQEWLNAEPERAYEATKTLLITKISKSGDDSIFRKEIRGLLKTYRHVELPLGRLTTTQFEILFDELLENPSKFKSLKFDACFDSDRALQLFEKLTKLSQSSNSELTVDLDLRQSLIGTLRIQALEQALQALRNTQITSLNLRNNRIDSASIQVLKQALSTSKVRHLNLSGNQIDDEGAQVLAQILLNNQMTRLEKLNVSANRIRDVGAQALEQAKAIRNIQIDIRDQISDAGIQVIAQNLPNTQITPLNLSANQIGDAGVQVIAQNLHNTQQYTYLDLSLNLPALDLS